MDQKESLKAHDGGDSATPAPDVEKDMELSEKSGDERQSQSSDVLETPPDKALPGPDEEEHVTGVKIMFILAAVTGACFIMLLDTSIVATAIPRITNQFHSLPDIGWYGSSYLLASASLQPMTGKIYSRFTAKWVFMSFLFLFELGSLLCGVATSSKMLIVGRAVAGMGASGIVNGALTIIALCTPLEKRPAYLGIMMGIGQLGIAAGPLVGGALTEYATWRWCFYINLPIGGLVILALVFVHIPKPKHQMTAPKTYRATFESLDPIGFILFAPAAIMFLIALEWGGVQYRWGSSTIIGLFCGAGGTFAIFLGWEYKRGDTAMIPFGLLKRRVVYSSCLSMFFISANLLTTSYYLSIYFQAVRGAKPLMAGVDVLPTIIAMLMLAVSSGILVSRLGYYLPWALAGTAATTIGTGLMSTFTPTTPTDRWIGYQIIGGMGRGACMQMSLIAVQNHVAPAEIPVSMSVLIFFQTLGSSLFLSFAQTTFTNGLMNALPHFAPGVDVQQVVDAGASNFRTLIDPKFISGIILAYNQAVSHVFYLATGAIAAGFLFSCGLGWKSVKKQKVVAPEA